MGVSAIPGCREGCVCEMINYATRNLVYTNFSQSLVGPSGYFRDPLQLEEYYANSVFLPILNNELDSVSDEEKARVKQRFTALDKVLLVAFENDTVVYPGESAWF
jgi:hypothetical protein